MSADLSQSPIPLAEISQGPNAFELFLDRNQKNLIVLAILLALGVAALVVYRGIEQSHEESAGAALNKAEDLTSLQTVIQEHAGTAAASSAMVILAERQWTDGQQDAALETLRKFISANPAHPALPTAQASLASKLMTQGKSAEATEMFKALADNPTARFIAPYALISLGDIAKLAGDPVTAEISYKRVQTDFSDSQFADTAKRRIAALKAKMPAEIEAPPTPKTDNPSSSVVPQAAASAVQAPPGQAPVVPEQKSSSQPDGKTVKETPGDSQP